MTHSLLIDDEVLVDFAETVGEEGPVSIVGTSSHRELISALDSGARQVAAPQGVVEVRPEEMMVTVRAGTAVSDLHDVLAQHGQRTSLPEGGTVGGAVAVGHNSLQRLGRGSVRDAVLQIRYVSAEGRLVTGGGPVVKNVSGFNIPKLLTGSLGTLGFVAEVILRTNPIPALSRVFEVAASDPLGVFHALHSPSMMLWDGQRVLVELEGHPDDVDAESAVLTGVGATTELRAMPDLAALDGPRVTLTPAEAANLRLDGPFIASIGVGTVWVEDAVVLDGLDAVRVDAGAREVMVRMKQRFDPTGRLNPGIEPWS